MKARVEYLRARYESDQAEAHERHTLGCEIHNDPFLEDGVWEKRCENWRDLCDCKTRTRLVDASMKRRMLDELHPELEGADSLIAGEWGSSDDLADKLLDLLMLPYYHREDCRYDWVDSADRKPEKCVHDDAYEVVPLGESEARQHCPDCCTTWQEVRA